MLYLSLVAYFQNSLDETKSSYEDRIGEMNFALTQAHERIASLETKLNETLEREEEDGKDSSDHGNDDKVLLENECSELKEKLENLLQELSKVKRQNQDLQQNQNAVAQAQDFKVRFSTPLIQAFLCTFTTTHWSEKYP